jgi:cell division protein FtsL
MPDNIEALGDVVTGGLLARAVEPGAGEGQGQTAGNCLNCGAVLAGAYCSVCGQKARVHRTLGAFGHDLAHSVFHFDGKIWRTLPLLAWKPGELTRRYIHGERARFVSPFAIFLFSVFLMVAIFSWIMPKFDKVETNVTAAEALSSLKADRAEVTNAIAELERSKKAAAGSDVPTGWMDGEIARNRELLKQLDTKAIPHTTRAVIAERKLLVQERAAEIELKRLEVQLAEARKTGKPTQAIQDDIAGVKLGMRVMKSASASLGDSGFEQNGLNLDLGIPAVSEAIAQATKNPQLVLYKIQSNAYKFSWALIPISVPFVWLLFFWRRDLHLFDHAVFVTYSLSFMTLLMTVCVIAIQFAPTEAVGGLALVFGPPVHMYRQLKGAYQLGRIGAAWRTVFLATFSVTALALFGALVLTLGLAH